MAVIQTGSGTTGVANVDSSYNLNVNLPATQTQAGFATVQYEQDSGAITGSRLIRKPEVSYDDRLSVGMDTPLALYNFTATTQNTGDFKHAFTTMTMTQSSGFLNINPALSTVSGNYAYLQSWQHFTQLGDGDLHVEFTGSVSAAVPANQTLEAGLFVGTAGVTPTDGVFFRLNDSGLRGVIVYGGVETPTGVIAASITPGVVGKFKINISQRQVEFWMNDVLGGIVATPAGNAVPYLTLNLPACVMMRNSNTVTGGFTTRIGTFHISQRDLNVVKPWASVKAIQGDAYQGQEGDTQGSLAIYSNAALGAAAALTNTTAAAPNTGLGGAVLVLPTLASGTDGILLSYQNPAGSVTQPPKTLVVTGIRIDASVQVVLAGGPLTLIMGAAFGHTAVSLATTESASFATGTTKSPRRVVLGNLDFAAAAAAGTGAVGIAINFNSPIVVNPGQFFSITCRNVGTVTTTGALAFGVMVDHYFE